MSLHKSIKNLFATGGLFCAMHSMAQVTTPKPYYNTAKASYVREWSATAPEQNPATLVTRPVADVKQTTRYVDGLGRTLQTVDKQMSPGGRDIVTPVIYDAFGREAYKYAPFMANIATGGDQPSDGNLKTDPFQEQAAFTALLYPGQTYFYSRTDYEPSPLNRTSTVYPAGNGWVGLGKGVSNQYLLNTASDSVYIWTLANARGSLPVTNSFYAAGTLYKDVSVDEANHRVAEYKDLEGHVVLKRVQLWNTPAAGHSGWLNTYYVFDDVGNQRFVMQPKAVEWLQGNGWSFATAGGTVVANELCFRYEFDGRRRMIIKKLPGAGEEWMVWDARDRQVMMQDSSMRQQHKWLFTRYDALNRPDSTGFMTDPSNYNNLLFHLSQARSSISYPVLSGYTVELLTQTFYDNYNWVTSSGSGLASSMATNNTSNSNYFVTSYNTSPVNAVPVASQGSNQGFVTGTMTKVLGTASQYLYAVSFYDDRGRLIQSQSRNYTGGIDTTTVQFNFGGKPLRSLVGHRKNGNTVQNHVVLTKNNYDAADRIKNVIKNIDNTGDQLIDSLLYNDMGQMKVKYLGNLVDSLVYEYNLRGWTTSVNKNYLRGTANHYFGMELGYDQLTSVTGGSFAAAQYNGNIAGTIWKGGGDGVNRKYDFKYDNVDRLTTAAFTQNTTAGSWDSAKLNFSVSNLSYDANGNILTMNQSGYKISGSGLIDQLTYNYQPTSNKLSLVNDGANDPASPLGDFHYTGTKSPADYTYDGKGNLATDNNKAIDNIAFNHLSLPQLVHIKSRGNIFFTYDAGGNKLSKVLVDSVTKHTTTTLYMNGIVYQHRDTITNPTAGIDTLQFLGHEEGRARWAFHRWLNGTTQYKWEYDFAEKDNLGNTRELLTQQRDTALYKATMEAAYRATENALFYNIASTCVGRIYVPGTYPSDPNATVPNDSVSRLSGSTPKEGPAIILKVMAGDKFDVSVNALYRSGTGTGTTSAVTEILSSLANGVFALTGGTKGGISVLNNGTTSPLLPAINSFRTDKTPTPVGKPMAYLNYMALDDQFNYDSQTSGAVVVGGPDVLGPLAATGITVKKNGYLYIYVSNETKDLNVFFDNLSVAHYTGPLLEENHYYPYGLTMAAISDRALKTQYAIHNYKYNGIEYDSSFSLDEYEAHYRDLDPQTGRWWQIDPKIDAGYESVTPYASMNNNPARYSDEQGDEASGCCKAVWNAVKEGTKMIVGGGSAMVVGTIDNALGTNIRGSVAATNIIQDPSIARGWNAGLDVADIGAISGGGAESTFGGGLAATSATVTGGSGGLSIEITGPTFLAGLGLAIHGVYMQRNGTANLISQNGHVPVKGVPNPDGSKGKPDHQAKVDELEKKAQGELQQGETVVRERKIKADGSNRRPDVQIVDKDGKTRKVFEAERKPDSQRNKKREKEYDNLDIDWETWNLIDPTPVRVPLTGN